MRSVGVLKEHGQVVGEFPQRGGQQLHQIGLGGPGVESSRCSGLRRGLGNVGNEGGVDVERSASKAIE